MLCQKKPIEDKSIRGIRLLEEKGKRRGKLGITAEILEITRHGALKTQIMYRANLSFAQLGNYLKFMANAGLLVKFCDSGREVYAATEKGLGFLRMYSELAGLLNESSSGAKISVKISL